jgi:hypothetical protein
MPLVGPGSSETGCEERNTGPGGMPANVKKDVLRAPDDAASCSAASGKGSTCTAGVTSTARGMRAFFMPATGVDTPKANKPTAGEVHAFCQPIAKAPTPPASVATLAAAPAGRATRVQAEAVDTTPTEASWSAAAAAAAAAANVAGGWPQHEGADGISADATSGRTPVTALVNTGSAASSAVASRDIRAQCDHMRLPCGFAAVPPICKLPRQATLTAACSRAAVPCSEVVKREARGRSLLLFEDFDLLLNEDPGFLSSVKALLEKSKV